MGCLKRACVWPVVKNGLCAWHLRDEQAPSSFYEDRPVHFPKYEDGNRGNPKEKETEKAISMLMKRRTVPEVVKATGLHENTVYGLRKRLAQGGALHPLCRCGKPRAHRGRCGA